MISRAGIIVTEVGYRALELASRTRFFGLQRLLGVKEVYEQRQEAKDEQENDGDVFVGFHVRSSIMLRQEDRRINDQFSFFVMRFLERKNRWSIDITFLGRLLHRKTQSFSLRTRTGSETVNVLPRPTSLWTVKRPP